MPRILKNRYRLKIDGLVIEISLSKDFCDSKTDKEITEEILRIHRFWRTLDFVEKGGQFELEMIRASKGVSN